MNTKNEKEYIEPEVIKNGQKTKNEAEDFAHEKIHEQIKDMKKAAFVKGGTLLLPYIAGGLVFLFLLFGLIFLIFDEPFDWIITAIIAFFMIRGVMRMLKMFK